MVKNHPPTTWETCIQSLGWENTLEKGMAARSSILAWKILMDREAWWTTGAAKSQPPLSDFFTFFQSMWLELVDWVRERRTREGETADEETN